jgi:hypothetical protein
VNKSESIKELAVALNKFQSEMQNPKNTESNTFFHSKYAPLPDIINHIKPILAKCGLSIFQSVGGDGENISVTSMLIHNSGEYIESEPLKIKNQDQKGVSLAQAAGISITYARRYSLSAILGISSEDDTDGNTGSQQNGNNQSEGHTESHSNDLISKPQANRIYALSGANAEICKTVLKSYGYSKSDEVQKKDYDNICKAVQELAADKND